jgi:hypothetical protein
MMGSFSMLEGNIMVVCFECNEGIVGVGGGEKKNYKSASVSGAQQCRIPEDADVVVQSKPTPSHAL